MSRQESGELFVAPLARRAFVRGESCLLDGVTSDALRALDAPAAAVGALLTKLDARSLVSVPIRGRERAVVGVISYAVSSDSARRFDAGELGVLEELSRRIALAMENAQLYAGARHAVESRDEFLSIASHELRTPLTSLVLQVQSLRRVVRRSGEAMPTEKVEPRLETIEKQVDRLTSLIEDLLDVSRAVSGKFALQYSEGDLKKVVKDVVNRFKDDAERAGCELTLTAERCEGTWDQLRFEQVLSNLITNGLKYGAGRPVEVQLMADDERAHVLVRDRGIGIAPADHARIFERFERAVSHQHFGGLGLGLWISKRIVEAMGGRISLRSASGEGAEFLVSLPRRPAAETQDESAVQG